MTGGNDDGIDRRGVLAGTLGAFLPVQPPTPSRAQQTRIDASIAAMTLPEKAGQLSCFNDEIRPVGAVFNPVVNRWGADAVLPELRAGRVGMLFNGYGVADARRAAVGVGESIGHPAGVRCRRRAKGGSRIVRLMDRRRRGRTPPE